MKPAEVRQLIRLRQFELSRERRVPARCHDLNDLQRDAARRLPRPVLGYLEGGAGEELTLRANTQALRRWRFRPVVACGHGLGSSP